MSSNNPQSCVIPPQLLVGENTGQQSNANAATFAPKNGKNGEIANKNENAIMPK